jgi:hypothetical protein
MLSRQQLRIILEIASSCVFMVYMCIVWRIMSFKVNYVKFCILFWYFYTFINVISHALCYLHYIKYEVTVSLVRYSKLNSPSVIHCEHSVHGNSSVDFVYMTHVQTDISCSSNIVYFVQITHNKAKVFLDESSWCWCTHLWNVCILWRYYTALYSRRLLSSY